MSIRSMSETRSRTRSVTFSIQPSLAPFVSQVYLCHFFSFTVNRIRRPYGTGILACISHRQNPHAGGGVGLAIGERRADPDDVESGEPEPRMPFQGAEGSVS